METLPSGFPYVRSSQGASKVDVDGQAVQFTLFGVSSFYYMVRVPTTEGEYTFSGIITNRKRQDRTVAGQIQLRVGPPPTPTPTPTPTSTPAPSPTPKTTPTPTPSLTPTPTPDTSATVDARVAAALATATAAATASTPTPVAVTPTPVVKIRAPLPKSLDPVEEESGVCPSWAPCWSSAWQ